MTSRVFIIPDAMDRSTCLRVQAAMDAGVPEPADVLDEKTELQDTVRRAFHIEVAGPILDLVGAHLDAQRDAIAAFFHRRLVDREGSGLLRYPVGGFYLPHVDRADLSSWPPAAERAVSVVLFLDSCRQVDPAGAFSGGLLRMCPDPHGGETLEIPPRRGTLVAFPATTRHEVTSVREGRRDAVVDWFR